MIRYLAQTLNEPSGKTSSQRTCLFLVLLCVLAWSTRIVLLKLAIPEIPESWVWLIGLLLSGIGFGKGAEVYQTVKGGKNVETRLQP